MLIGDKRLVQFFAAVGLSFALSVGPPSTSRAEDSAPAAPDAAPKTAANEAEPVTTKDPQIALDDLELLLEPMTKEETETEAKSWFALLRAKERGITVARLVRLALAAPTMDQLDMGLGKIAAMLHAREDDFDSTE